MKNNQAFVGKIMLSRSLFALAGVLALGASFAGSAQALEGGSFLKTVEGQNDCGAGGAFGSECDIDQSEIDALGLTGQLDPTPLIFKVDFDDDGNATELEVGEEYGFINMAWLADNFTFNFDGGSEGADGNTGTGIWQYTGSEDLGITAYSAKGGNNFNLFENEIDFNFGEYYTPENNGGKTPGLSHLTFWNSREPQPPVENIPEPAAMVGLLAVGAGIVVNRRKKTLQA